ncbi:hypothetical protein [Niveispirillum sp. BGYR6]|uniref:hypothetical protein n=1 Tax=Niveispirillum sp. BGYR6 TaxID=2971249 RepID=UPI0022B98D4B|nr:hypothetical protein [Niveispirillum sp. BGYR6]MDG5495400.1 hypothetical protein [Niveispirillum sp. BGYR6]
MHIKIVNYIFFLILACSIQGVEAKDLPPQWLIGDWRIEKIFVQTDEIDSFSERALPYNSFKEEVLHISGSYVQLKGYACSEFSISSGNDSLYNLIGGGYYSPGEFTSQDGELYTVEKLKKISKYYTINCKKNLMRSLENKNIWESDSPLRSEIKWEFIPLDGNLKNGTVQTIGVPFFACGGCYLIFKREPVRPVS